jgi:hypothetical protein
MRWKFQISVYGIENKVSENCGKYWNYGIMSALNVLHPFFRSQYLQKCLFRTLQQCEQCNRRYSLRHCLWGSFAQTLRSHKMYKRKSHQGRPRQHYAMAWVSSGPCCFSGFCQCGPIPKVPQLTISLPFLYPEDPDTWLIGFNQLNDVAKTADGNLCDTGCTALDCVPLRSTSTLRRRSTASCATAFLIRNDVIRNTQWIRNASMYNVEPTKLLLNLLLFHKYTYKICLS